MLQLVGGCSRFTNVFRMLLGENCSVHPSDPLFRSSAEEDFHHDDGDTREARAARRAEARERRQLDLLAESHAWGAHRAKRQRREVPDDAGASMSDSEEPHGDDASDVEARLMPDAPKKTPHSFFLEDKKDQERWWNLLLSILMVQQMAIGPVQWSKVEEGS